MGSNPTRPVEKKFKKGSERMKNDLPWNKPTLKDWSIVGMNHYHVKGEKNLFCAMTKDQECIKAEGTNEIKVFEELEKKARKRKNL